MLDLDDSRWRAIGAEYHSGHWSFVETNLKGEILRAESRRSTELDPESFLQDLLCGLSEFQAKVKGELLPAFGIGAPGLVDCDRGVIIRADDLGWKNVRVADTVEKALGRKVLMINRNRGSGLAEARFGAGRGLHQMVYIGIGTGISAAFMMDGHLIHGSSFSAGEIGHITMDKTGPVCGCGKRGCLHVYASGPALARKAESFLSEGRRSILSRIHGVDSELRGEDVCTAAAAGDAVAMDCLRGAASYLGLEIANIVTSFNPDKVIIGGPIGLIESPLLELTIEQAAQWAMPHAFNAVRIERGILGDSVGALGGACRVLDRKLPLVLAARAEKGRYSS